MTPGKIRLLKYLGNVQPTREYERTFAVFYIKYESAAPGLVAAKLAIPLGHPPASRWPVSLWCHGFGDPGGDLYKWPFRGNDWRLARGELACRWARHGIVTLAPWLPGAGPAEPVGTYSPLSLERNATAVLDGFVALQSLGIELVKWASQKASHSGLHPQWNNDCQVLRVDCLSSPLMIEIASKYRSSPQCTGLKALVADNFQPSVAYTVTFLGPLMRELPALDAARLYCVWGRLLWSLAAERGWPPTTFLSPQALELFGEPISTPAGPLARIVAQPFQPGERNELARAVASAAVRGAPAARGKEVSDWMFSADCKEWFCLTPLSRETLTHPFYKTYLASSDPFFPETIAPFSPDIPLFVVPRVTARQVKKGMPDIELRRREMTSRKIETLKSWGWEVLVCPESHCYGTSFGEGLARKWTIGGLKTRLGLRDV